MRVRVDDGPDDERRDADVFDPQRVGVKVLVYGSSRVSILKWRMPERNDNSGILVYVKSDSRGACEVA